MAIEISDAHPDEVEAVRSYCGVPGAGTEARPRLLDMTAHVGGAMVGALICRGEGQRGRVKSLTVRGGGDAGSRIAQRLVDKAMRKLQVQSIRRCRINVAPPDTDDAPDSCHDSFWDSVGWPSLPEFDGSGHVTRAIRRT